MNWQLGGTASQGEGAGALEELVEPGGMLGEKFLAFGEDGLGLVKVAQFKQAFPFGEEGCHAFWIEVDRFVQVAQGLL